MRNVFVLILLLATAAAAESPRGKAEHVVLVVWDGMRPDFVTEKNAPTLCRLAREGVTFRNHHSVFPSLTNQNSTVLATGVLPKRSGLLANYEYRPALATDKFIRTDQPAIVRKGDELSGGRYLGAPTIAEMVRAAGGRTAIAGGKTTSLLHDRAQRADDDSVTAFSGETLPASALMPIAKLLGEFPDLKRTPGLEGDAWTTKALTGVLWKDAVPRYSVLWLSEPDRAEHAFGPGSEAAIAAIKSSDENLAEVLRALEEKGVREKTDVFVVSDHGFSTIDRTVDLRTLLREAGFTIITDGESPKNSGEVRVVGNGGTIFFYITGHEPEVAARLVRWLQASKLASVIFSQAKCEGAFPLTQAHLDTETAPDVVMTFAWSDKKNKDGAPGMIDALPTTEVVAGTHGTLSRFDLHNILFVSGPDFRRGATDDLPTSNLDLAPTILRILGLEPKQKLDGRILREAMPNESGSSPVVSKESIEAIGQFSDGEWRQYLRTSKIGDEIYLDEGNGAWTPK